MVNGEIIISADTYVLIQRYPKKKNHKQEIIPFLVDKVDAFMFRMVNGKIIISADIYVFTVHTKNLPC